MANEVTQIFNTENVGEDNEKGDLGLNLKILSMNTGKILKSGPHSCLWVDNCSLRMNMLQVLKQKQQFKPSFFEWVLLLF